LPGNLSEKALSESLKELMRHVNFSRITIDDICEKAGVISTGISGTNMSC